MAHPREVKTDRNRVNGLPATEVIHRWNHSDLNGIEMPITRKLTFVIAVNSREVFKSNFLASPLLLGPHPHELVVQEKFRSATDAYNDAINKSANDLIVFAHQDIIFPGYWLSQLERALEYLNVNDPHWGVLGCYGKSYEGSDCGHVYSSGRGIIGAPFTHPVPVQTLDEIVLVMRKSSGLRFDDQLPHFHLYGTDICLAAMKRGMKSYAIPAFCIHNTQQHLIFPPEFYECCRHIKRRWKEYLPIRTACTTITKYGVALFARRLQEIFLRVRRKRVGGYRLQDPQELLTKFERYPSEASTEMGLSFLTRFSQRVLRRWIRTERGVPSIS